MGGQQSSLHQTCLYEKQDQSIQLQLWIHWGYVQHQGSLCMLIKLSPTCSSRMCSNCLPESFKVRGSEGWQGDGSVLIAHLLSVQSKDHENSPRMSQRTSQNSWRCTSFCLHWRTVTIHIMRLQTFKREVLMLIDRLSTVVQMIEKCGSRSAHTWYMEMYPLDNKKPKYCALSAT